MYMENGREVPLPNSRAEKLEDGIRDLRRRVSNARLNAMLELTLEGRWEIAGDLLDEVERELNRLEDL